MEPFVVNDFSGGITDGYLKASPNRSYILDNLWLDENMKPYTRPGIACFTERVPTSGSDTRVSGVYVDTAPYGLPIVVRTNKAYVATSADSWTEILGPSLNAALPNKGNTNLETGLFWNKQLIIASEGTGFQPQRIICTTATDTTGSFLAIELGLPSVAAPTATTTPGTESYIYAFHWFHVFQDADGTVYEQSGPVTQLAIPSITAPDSANVAFTGMPTLTNTTTQNFDTRTFVKTGVARTNASAVLTGFSSTADLVEGMALTGTGLAVGATILSKTSTTVTMNKAATSTGTGMTVTCFPLMLRIYRTTTNGSVFYLVADIPQTVVGYNDALADTTLDDNTTLYTTGDLVEYQQPPVNSKYVVQTDEFFWYAGDYFITQSIQASPGAVPAEYLRTTDQKVKGLGSILSYPILFCDRSVYRVEGVFDEFGDGGFDFKEIHKTAGCVSNSSIVAVPGGLVWAGNGGFYFTNGNDVRRISNQLPVRYQQWADGSVTGVFDSRRSMVHWTVSSSSNSTYAPNNQCVTLHLNAGITEESCFSTWGSRRNIYPTALAYSESSDVSDDFRAKILIGEAQGYFLYVDDLVYTDPLLDTTIDDTTTFKRMEIIYDCTSVGFEIGGPVRNYCTEITASFQTDTEMAVQFQSRREDGGPWASLSELRVDGPIIWGVSEYGWDDPNDSALHDWGSQPMLEGMRRFPAGTLRSSRRQLRITNAYTYIAKSDVMGTVTIVPGTRRVTLNNATFFWPADCERYCLSFESDSYDFQYIIKSRDSDTQVTVYDPYSTLPTSSTEAWVLRGYRKNEQLNLLSYTVWSEAEGTTQAPSLGSSSYKNA
jgi:hypothetical protein